MSNTDSPVFQGPQPIDDPTLKWELFWEKNKGAILGAIALAIIGTLGVGAWFIYSNLRTTAAQKLLADATGIEHLQAVVEKYPGTMPAADALMRLAAAHREAGDLEKSTAAFRSFLEKFADHPLAGGALLGIGQNQDATGNADAAVATYQQVVTRYPQSYAAPFAAYSEAEILLRRFQREEARRSFNMVVTQFPQSPAARMASAQLGRIGNSQPARASVAEPAATAVPVQ
jgi:tetratricopeptide (TPR) repeat protein